MEMIYNMIEFLMNAYLIGVLSYVWIMIILDANNFGFIYTFASNLCSKRILNKHLFKVLFQCYYCFAGQTALWFYLIYYGLDNYNLFYHISFISTSILSTKIINKKYG